MLRTATSLLVVLCAFVALYPDALAQERWQVTLRSSEMLYELQPQSLSGDTLILRQGASIRRIPLREITELRRVRGTVELAERAGRPSIAALAGTDDEVFQMTLLDVAEKRELIQRIVQAYGPRLAR